MSSKSSGTEATGSRASQVYEHVVASILRGDYGPLGKLPTESELARSHGVSRPTVREALSRLRSDGVVDSKRGAGTFVVRKPGAPVAAVEPIRSLADIERYYAFRSCIESGAAAAAAEFRTAADLDTLQAAFAALNAKEDDHLAAVDEDVAFHLAIAHCSHNRFFIVTIETAVAPIRQFMELAHDADDRGRQQRLREARAEHQAIIDAIGQGSPEQAAEAVRDHLRNAKRRIFEATRF